MQPLATGHTVPGDGGGAPGHRHHQMMVDVLILDPVDLSHRQSGVLGWFELFVFRCRSLDLEGVSSISLLRQIGVIRPRCEARTERVLKDELLHLLVTEMLMAHMMMAIIVITFLAPASAGLWRGPGSLKDISTALLVLKHTTAAAASLLLSVLESYLASDNKLSFFIGPRSTGRMSS